MSRRKVEYPGYVPDGRQFLAYFRARGSREMRTVSVWQVEGGFRVFPYDDILPTLEAVTEFITARW